jgi:hypothetical protein
MWSAQALSLPLLQEIQALGRDANATSSEDKQ